MTDRAASRTRDDEVLAVLRPAVPVTPAVVARLLNPPLSPAARPWCPVGPPRAGERCASVPRASRERVRAVLRRLEAAGRIRRVWPGTRHAHWVLAP